MPTTTLVFISRLASTVSKMLTHCFAFQEDEEEIIERRRKERQALMSKLNGGQNSSTDKTPATKMFEVVSAGTELIDDDRESEDDDNGDADSNNGFDMVSDESPGKYPAD
jgi:hypothetical protein